MVVKFSVTLRGKSVAVNIGQFALNQKDTRQNQPDLILCLGRTGPIIFSKNLASESCRNFLHLKCIANRV